MSYIAAARKQDANFLGRALAEGIFQKLGRRPWQEVHLTVDELSEILRLTIENTRNES